MYFALLNDASRIKCTGKIKALSMIQLIERDDSGQKLYQYGEVIKISIPAVAKYRTLLAGK
jgi:hypothetical protein